MIARQDIALVVRNHRDMYEAMIKNDFIMPKRNSNIVTLEFMFEAQQEIMWLPKRGDVVQA